jgi:hypothetical protein
MLQKQSTNRELFDVLEQLMVMPLLASFRLVGGTALSLIKGHRISIDIDLFTAQKYGTIDFGAIESEIKKKFAVVENFEDEFPHLKAPPNNRGLHLQIGVDEKNLVKTDILYWEDFLFAPMMVEGIRMATVEEIGTMKLDVVSRGGRKKDFWDLVEIFDDYNLPHLMEVYQRKYPYHKIEDVKKGLYNFLKAEEVPDPICLKGRTWQMVKARVIEEANQL